MSVTTKPEVWLRGPVNNIPALLQPVAHALMQAREEVIQLMMGFPATVSLGKTCRPCLCWLSPAAFAWGDRPFIYICKWGFIV